MIIQSYNHLIIELLKPIKINHMRRLTLLLGLFVAFTLQTQAQFVYQRAGYPIKPIELQDVEVSEGFWKDRIETTIETTIPHTFEQCEKTGRISNFRRAAGLEEGNYQGGAGYNDSDVYKILEGACYALMIREDEELREYVDNLVSYMAGAQEESGLLYTAWTLRANDDNPDIRCSYKVEPFDNLGSSHALYNPGHMYEAAVAHYLATGERTLLEVAIKNADLMWEVFGLGKRKGYPGHEEMEVGLVKLYQVTGDKRYLTLSELMLERRGRGYRRSRTYSQDHKPVAQQDQVVGHAVRAIYMYMAMADVGVINEREPYWKALHRLWDNLTHKQIYVTGGIGAGAGIEGFDDNYTLPNDSYCETCAAIANVMWNYRLFLKSGDSKYVDILEKSLYNGLISGVSMEGDGFFYVNPLEVTEENKHRKHRHPWFGTACCPSNIARIIPSLPGYVYATKGNEVFVNLFMNSQTTLETEEGLFTVSQQSNYPWEGDIRIQVDPQQEGPMTLKVRIPGWSRNEAIHGDLYNFQQSVDDSPRLQVNGSEVDVNMENGYAVISRQWEQGDEVALQLPMQPRRVFAHEKVEADRGKTALQYGPIVYCFEGVDNGPVSQLYLPDDAEVEAEYKPEMLNGVMTLQTRAPMVEVSNGKAKTRNRNITAIPYYSWSHRGPSSMQVWVPRKLDNVSIK